MAYTNYVAESVAQFVNYAIVVVVLMIIYYIGKFFMVPPPTKADREAAAKQREEDNEKLREWVKDKFKTKPGKEGEEKEEKKEEKKKGHKEDEEEREEKEEKKEEEEEKEEEKEEKKKEDKKKEKKKQEKKRDVIERVDKVLLKAVAHIKGALESLGQGDTAEANKKVGSAKRCLTKARDLDILADIARDTPYMNDARFILARIVQLREELNGINTTNIAQLRDFNVQLGVVIRGIGELIARIFG